MSFRLRGAVLERLEELSADTGRSVGELARDLVVAGLQEQGLDQVDEALGELTGCVGQLRADLALVLEALLLNVAKLPEDQVRRYVREQLHGCR